MHEYLEPVGVLRQLEESHDSDDGEELEVSGGSEDLLSDEVDVEGGRCDEVDQVHRSLESFLLMILPDYLMSASRW